MIKGQLYKYLHKYFDEYLFGFDKSKLEIALLSGNIVTIIGQIELKDVNLRPEKINNNLAAFNLPFGIKAGMINKFRLRYSILSWTSTPFELVIEDLQLIIGPSMNKISNESSSLAEKNEKLSYNSSNCYNIFTHNVKIALKSSFNINNRTRGDVKRE